MIKLVLLGSEMYGAYLRPLNANQGRRMKTKKLQEPGKRDQEIIRLNLGRDPVPRS
jgi:hypothetical protein